MLSDLFLTLSERILVATSDEAILVTSGFKKKSSTNQQLESRCQTIVQQFDRMQCVHQLFQLLPLLRQRVVKYVTVSEEHQDLQLLTHAGVKVMMVMEKVLSAVNDMYTIKTIVPNANSIGKWLN